MPTTTWLGKIKSFLNPTIFTLLQEELDKKPTEESLEKITALIKTLFLKNESIPADLFDAYPNALIKTLKTIRIQTK